MQQKTWQVLSVMAAGLFMVCLVLGGGQALASKYFTFTYTYFEGDYYQGRGYINSTSPDYSLYVVGYTKTMMDESKNNGTYKITSVTISNDETKNNYIYVDKYYDKESNNTFIPVSVGKAVGTQGLGSERDYIQETGKSCFYFGYNSTYKYIAEADVSVIYAFSYTFGNGDYYTGTVYAKPTYGYYFNSNTDYYSLQKKDENNQMGLYKITGIKGYYDHSNDGKVMIHQYFNSENNTLYTPVTSQSGGYLGKEYGWIIKSNEPHFYFGNYSSVNYEADVGDSNRYTFSYTFKNSDRYEGFVYAPASQGYSVGYTKSFLDEHGLVGEYKITGAIAGFDNRRDGQVFVTKYYDSESSKSFTPLGFRSPESTTPLDNLAKGVGLNYLGSEKDYIIRNNVPEYYFGAGEKNGAPAIFEADLVWVEYAFKYTYGNGDYYEGSVWARMDYGYYSGYSKATVDENGSQGKYYISSFKLLDDPTIFDGVMGQVFVNKYYDKEANTTFTPVSAGEAVGWEYLGSEYDYILQAGNPEFFFGGGYEEADVSCAYSFKFVFGNGDYYTGTVYALPGYIGPSIKDENGLTGKYTILGVRAYVDSSRNGQVYLSRYFDVESRKTYTPLQNNLPAGNNFLGSEGGYIIQMGKADFYFGKGRNGLDPNKFYEADQAYRYNFQFTYGGRDSYTGYVYGAPDLYSLTYTKSVLDENGKTGRYTITGITSGFDLSQNGKVYVSSYYDAETGNTYTPLNSGIACGTNYLGSEFNYIIENGNAVNLFGKYSDGKFYEADVAANIAYSFIFYYNNKNGDYYSGVVYRAANNIYYKGYTLNKIDENGQPGYYLITGGVSAGDNSTNNGKVIVNSYYNHENNTAYTPLNVTGSNYLGSETGFIYQTTSLMYRFGYYGGKFYEADVN